MNVGIRFQTQSEAESAKKVMERLKLPFYDIVLPVKEAGVLYEVLPPEVNARFYDADTGEEIEL